MDGIATPDGRLVAYREFGDPDGVPVVNCHGGLLCGLDVEPADSTGRRMGIRLISPDRPGVGFSTNVPNRTTADWAGDVAALADALDLGRFGSLGWSMGGQYALALAALLPDRVSAAVVVAGTPPLTRSRITQLGETDRRLLHLATDRPRVASLVFRGMGLTARALPGVLERSTRRSLSEPDRRAFDELPQGSFARWMAHAMRQPAGMVEEYLAWARPWGFSLDDVTCHTTIWQGDEDALAPAVWAEQMERAIPDATVRLVAGAGHFVAYRNWPQVLSAFVR